MTQTKLDKVQNVSSGVSANVLDSFSKISLHLNFYVFARHSVEFGVKILRSRKFSIAGSKTKLEFYDTVVFWLQSYTHRSVHI